MNREILFRGKPDIDQEWLDEMEFTLDEYMEDLVSANYKDGFVYGQVVYSGNRPYIVGEVVESTDEWITLEYWIPVIPKTVGQKSGLKERPGIKDIWQGDVVKITLVSFISGKPIAPETRMVELRDGMFGVEWGNDKHFMPLAHFAPGTIIEVIGTIHDNPELLEVRR